MHKRPVDWNCIHLQPANTYAQVRMCKQVCIDDCNKKN